MPWEIIGPGLEQKKKVRGREAKAEKEMLVFVSGEAGGVWGVGVVEGWGMWKV